MRSESVFFYACNRRCAHWYFVSHAGRKYSCTHVITFVFTGISCRTQPVSVLCSTHAMVAVLTDISCYMQCVSALYACQRYAPWYSLSHAVRKCPTLHTIVAVLTVILCRTQIVSVLVLIQLLLCPLVFHLTCRV